MPGAGGATDCEVGAAGCGAEDAAGCRPEGICGAGAAAAGEVDSGGKSRRSWSRVSGGPSDRSACPLDGVELPTPLTVTRGEIWPIVRCVTPARVRSLTVE